MPPEVTISSLLTRRTDPETRDLFPEEMDPLFTGHKISMEIEDVQLDPGDGRNTPSPASEEEEKEATRHAGEGM